MSATALPDLLTRKEVADICRVHQHTVFVWAKKGKIPPPRRVGRKLLWRLEDIRAFIDTLAIIGGCADGE